MLSVILSFTDNIGQHALAALAELVFILVQVFKNALCMKLGS